MSSNIRTDVTSSIQDKHLEIRYNEKVARINGKKTKIELQGKIKCPVLNQGISPIVCAHLMDKEGWPRCMKADICAEAGCFINVSIKSFATQKAKGSPDGQKDQKAA